MLSVFQSVFLSHRVDSCPYEVFFFIIDHYFIDQIEMNGTGSDFEYITGLY